MAFNLVLTFSILSLFLFSFSTSHNSYTFSIPQKHNLNSYPFSTPQKKPNPNSYTSPTSQKLTPNFYDNSCPALSGIINAAVTIAIINETRMGASLLRLHFHDCFVNGCDASILLDDTPTFTGEKTARPNNNSVRGFEVIDAIKNAVDVICPQVVSCADILAIAARDSVVRLGGFGWSVNLGRRDSLTANFAAANSGNTIPFPTMNLTTLIALFQNQGLDQTDLVALSGSHTIGQARCTNFRARIYNETNIDSGFASQAQASCPSVSGSGDNNLEPLDIQSPTSFDMGYFQDLVNQRVLLHSDQELYNGGSTDSIVDKYISNPGFFQTDFAKAMIKMGNIAPLTGRQGEIRKNCRVVNKN